MVQDELGPRGGIAKCTAACGGIAVLAWTQLLLYCAVPPRSPAVFAGSKGTNLHACWILLMLAGCRHLPHLSHRFALPLKPADSRKHGPLHLSLPVLQDRILPLHLPVCPHKQTHRDPLEDLQQCGSLQFGMQNHPLPAGHVLRGLRATKGLQLRLPRHSPRPRHPPSSSHPGRRSAASPNFLPHLHHLLTPKKHAAILKLPDALQRPRV